MPVSDLGGIQVPPGAAAWIDRVMLVFLGFVILWIVLKVAGFIVRRSYNLTPVATAGSKDVKPDFLKVDHDARRQLVERGREFDRMQSSGLAKALSATRFGVVASGVISVVSAAFLAFGRIEEFETTWRDLSVKERFMAIVESHPVGFAIALAMTVAALVRLIMVLRPAK